MYDWICYVCGTEKQVERKKPPAKEPIEGVCAGCRHKAYGFEGMQWEGRHTEHKDRSCLELVDGQSPFTVYEDMMGIETSL